MSQSIPMLSMSGTFLSNQILPIKGKWEALKQRKLNITELRREDDPNDAAHRSSEMELDPSISDPVGKSGSQEPLPVTHQAEDMNRQENCNNPGRNMPGYTVAEPSSATAPSTIVSAQDDEMLSWLHYPMDDNFERNYCSELFSDVANSGMQPFNSSSSSGRRTQIVTSATNSTSVVSLVQRPPNAEAAMALGAERAAGLSSQVGLEAFCRVRTSSQPPVPKWSSNPPDSPATGATSQQKPAASFPLYSSPMPTACSNAVTFKSPPELANGRVDRSCSLIGESASPRPRPESAGEAVQRKAASPVKKEHAGSLVSAGLSSSCRTKSFEHEEFHTGQKKHDPEPTITSSSGGSDNTTEKSEKAERTKRKAKQIDSADCCQSESFSCRQDAEGESVDTKKTTPTRPKRSRAAEVHNLSERRRRDRINEKMRALQELIPNSNKTDKASMLDEAIEYLKMLQLQLQMMSMRSGMSLPPMVMPTGVHQHLQMPQMAPLAPYGMGMGMGMVGMNMNVGMGMGMNLVDLGSPTSVRPIVSEPLQQHQQQQQQQQQQLLGEAYNVFVSQQQMQLPVQVMSREMYNSYMVPVNQTSQHQENQQQQHQQHHQQQQQLHQLHHHSTGFNQ